MSSVTTMLINNQHWKDVTGYEGLYQVSINGIVRKVDGRILSQCIRSNYKAVTLIKNKVEKLINVHRIVAITFLDNTNNLPQVNHKDECKLNNCVDNLEWCTAKYNLTYGNRIGLVIDKERKSVIQLNCDNKIINEYVGVNATKEYGFTPQAVSECCRGRRSIHKGSYWRFKND